MSLQRKTFLKEDTKSITYKSKNNGKSDFTKITNLS